jgi:hypothetical protein
MATEFQYVIVRVVPCLPRGERINAGVIVFCRQRDFLAAQVALDAQRLAAIAPGLDPEAIRPHLQALCDVAAGTPAAGPLGGLAPSERFGWLSAPASTIIQPSATHTGLTDDPAVTLARLFASLVAAPASECDATGG